jgi:hypothetical protein
MTSTPNEEEFNGDNRRRTGFFHRSLSPCSFERLRREHSDYFYKPKRGPSTSKSNITITRPIKTFETVTKLVELLSKGNNFIKTKHVEDIQSESLPKEQKCPSHYSSLLSMDGGDLSSKISSTFSSRSNSSISTVPEHESQIPIIEELPLININKKQTYTISSCHVPTIGINITMAHVHLVLLELYPQNVDNSIISFQRYLISLILNYEHEHWSISNVELQTKIEQEANFRLFTLTYDEFDFILKDLQIFLNSNSSSIASSLILNIALTGEQTSEYEMKISSRLNKINLNFDIISSRAETYMIGLEFFLENYQDEFIDILENRIMDNQKHQFYPYLLLHAEGTSTFFYIVHSPNKYSILTPNNLCYKTYSNLFKLLHPGYDQQISSSSPSIIRRPPPVSFDSYKTYHRTSTIFPSQVPLTSFTRIPQRYFPSDYSKSKTSHYIYRGWPNRKMSTSNPDLITYDVHTQTDDSFIELSSLQMRLAMHRSLLSMFTMNMSLIIKLLVKLYPSIHNCILTGEFFQLEKQAGQDLTLFLRSIIGEKSPRIYQLKRESLISAFGCALPRVYFDILDQEEILGNDWID